MISYICDRCGATYDWYETVYENSNFNKKENYSQISEYRKENGYYPIGFNSNCLKFMFFEPINTTYESNNSRISGDIEECDEDINELVMLCRNCMHEFMSTIDGFWEDI